MKEHRTRMFNDPSTATGITWKDLHGSLLLVQVHGQEVGIQTAHGESNAIRADVHVIDGDKEGEVYTDTLVFPKVLQSQLKPSIGSIVLGRLGQGQGSPASPRRGPLSAATDADKRSRPRLPGQDGPDARPSDVLVTETSLPVPAGSTPQGARQAGPSR